MLRATFMPACGNRRTSEERIKSGAGAVGRSAEKRPRSRQQDRFFCSVQAGRKTANKMRVRWCKKGDFSSSSSVFGGSEEGFKNEGLHLAFFQFAS